MGDWDRNKWQGRSKNQIEGNNKINDWTLILFILLLTLHLLIIFLTGNSF